jgi:hypothetical protein
VSQVRAVRHVLLLAALAAGCSGGSETPGATLHGPGALAVFDGVVSGRPGLRPYLAIGSERGDELRLLDTTNDEVVASPGMAFALSVPVTGRPMHVAAVDLGDGARPDALAVVASGADVLELVDTWGGHPRVVASVNLGAAATPLSVLAAPVPGATGRARVLVALAGGQLAVIELVRDAATDEIHAPAAPGAVLALGFDAVSLARSPVSDGYVWAASRDPLPGGVLGVARIALPADLSAWTTASVTAFDALAPTEQVAAVGGDVWDHGTGAWTGPVERVLAIPDPSACGPGAGVRCGLLAVDTVAPWEAGRGNLVANPVVGGEEPYLLPLPFPAPVLALAALGRTGAAPGDDKIGVTTAAGPTFTPGLAVATAANGVVYLVDAARWALASDSNPVAGTGRTRVSAASVSPAATSQLGLRPLAGGAASGLVEDLGARIRVTPGFTPDDDWTLAWQGAIPGLEARAAVVGEDAGTYWVAVQVGKTAPVEAAAIEALGLQVGDVVELDGLGAFCPSGYAGTVAGFVAAGADPARPGGAALLSAAGCLTGIPDATGTAAAVTFRSAGLLLTGRQSGVVARPSDDVEATWSGERLFYVTDACTAPSECFDNWSDGTPYSLSFPLPVGAAIGLRPGFLDLVGASIAGPPAGERPALSFTTRSGLAPSGRRPLSDGAPTAAELPSGLAVVDPGGNGAGVRVYASYTAGLVLSFSSADPASTVKLIR